MTEGDRELLIVAARVMAATGAPASVDAIDDFLARSSPNWQPGRDLPDVCPQCGWAALWCEPDFCKKLRYARVGLQAPLTCGEDWGDLLPRDYAPRDGDVLVIPPDPDYPDTDQQVIECMLYDGSPASWLRAGSGAPFELYDDERSRAILVYRRPGQP